jgi:integrase
MRNIATLVDAPSPPRPDVADPLSLAEANAVLAVAADERNAARWTVALALAPRQSEALALQWRDVDLARGTLSIRRTQQYVRGRGVVYQGPKTERSRRDPRPRT